jgi:hypothetical protein
VSQGRECHVCGRLPDIARLQDHAAENAIAADGAEHDQATQQQMVAGDLAHRVAGQAHEPAQGERVIGRERRVQTRRGAAAGQERGAPPRDGQEAVGGQPRVGVVGAQCGVLDAVDDAGGEAPAREDGVIQGIDLELNIGRPERGPEVGQVRAPDPRCRRDLSDLHARPALGPRTQTPPGRHAIPMPVHVVAGQGLASLVDIPRKPGRPGVWGQEGPAAPSERLVQLEAQRSRVAHLHLGHQLPTPAGDVGRPQVRGEVVAALACEVVGRAEAEAQVVPAPGLLSHLVAQNQALVQPRRPVVRPLVDANLVETVHIGGDDQRVQGRARADADTVQVRPGRPARQVAHIH